MTSGYGRISIDNAMRLAHRVAWTIFRGPIPDGMTIDHLCDNKSCVQVDHLRVVPIRDNVLRNGGPSARNAAKTSCARGHALSRRPGKGNRACDVCARPIGRAQAALVRAVADAHGTSAKDVKDRYGRHFGPLIAALRGAGRDPAGELRSRMRPEDVDALRSIDSAYGRTLWGPPSEAAS